MRGSLKSLALVGASVMVASAISGCGLNNPSDAQNDETVPPITAGSVGALAVASFGETSTISSTMKDAANSLSHLNASRQPAVGGLSKKGLGKSAALVETWTIDSSEAASQGIVKLIAVKKDLFFTEYDTLTVKYDAAYKDGVEGNENAVSAAIAKVWDGKSESCRITDLDNDGVAAGQPQYNGKARFDLRTTFTRDQLLGAKKGTSEHAVLDVDAGADRNFDKGEDNKIISGVWDKTLNGESLGHASYADADGDGYAFDAALKTPQAIDVSLYEKNPPLRFWVDYSRLSIRVITTDINNDKAGKIVKLSGEEGLVNGRVSALWVLDEKGDSIISENENVRAVFETVKAPAGDSIRTWRVQVAYNVGADLSTDTDDKYTEIHVKQTKRYGIVRARTFDFTTKEPLLHGTDPTSGHLEFSATYANGKSASVKADFEPGKFGGTYTDPDGAVTSVTWTAAGAVLTQAASN